MRLRRNAEVGVLEKAVERATEGGVPIGRQGVCVFARAKLLIAFGREVNVKVVAVYIRIAEAAETHEGAWHVEKEEAPAGYRTTLCGTEWPVRFVEETRKPEGPRCTICRREAAERGLPTPTVPQGTEEEGEEHEQGHLFETPDGEPGASS